MNNQPITIAVLAGTIRAQRKSHLAAAWVAEQGRALENVTIIYVDPTDFHFPGDGADPESKDSRYTEIVEKADAFLIVTPEYNHGYPSSLKRMLDSEYKHYYRKAVAVCGASDGPWGGTRVIVALLPVLRTLGLITSRNSANFTFVDKLFNEDGSMVEDKREQYEKSVNGVYKDLLWLTRALKNARQQDEQ